MRNPTWIRYANIAVWATFIIVMINWLHVLAIEFGVPWYMELLSGVTLAYVFTWFCWRLFSGDYN